VRGTQVFQAKGFPYRLEDLLDDPSQVERYRDGYFVTLRLKANMYHRFHAPCEGQVNGVPYISGDTWNVNPIALKRVEQLFCRNERAVLELVPPDGATRVALVPVAAILVASIRFNFLSHPLTLKHRGRNRLPCEVDVARGEELGRFEAGSTIVMFVEGEAALAEGLFEGATVRMGRPLLRPGHSPETI